MKRRDALRKLRTICERLDDVGPDFPVAPIRLYLFGSVLRDKDRPEDLDLLFETQRYPGSSGEFLAALVYGQPTPYDRAIQHLRHRMKMIRINELSEGTSPQDWFGYKEMPLDTPVRLVWEKGLDWRQVIDDIETHPVHWDPVSEESRKADLRARAQAVELGDRLLQASDGLGAVRHGLIERRSVPAWMRLAGHFYERGVPESVIEERFEEWAQQILALMQEYKKEKFSSMDELYANVERLGAEITARVQRLEEDFEKEGGDCTRGTGV